MRASIAMLTLTAALAAAGGAAAADSGAPARAQALREFSIAAQALSQALRLYAEQSGDQVVFYSDTVYAAGGAPDPAARHRAESAARERENRRHHRR